MRRDWSLALEFAGNPIKIFLMLFQLMAPSTAPTTQRRRMAVVLLCCALVGSADFINPCVASAQTTPTAQPTGVRDFVEYLSASRLLLNGV
ncbi:MAG: hypothetical protein ACXW6T_18230, partial [Candidatus Binatia bacterium]